MMIMMMISNWVRGFSAPTHLGLNRRALCAPYRIMRAVAPRQNLINLWVQEKNPDILLLFSRKSPQKNPLQVRQRGPYGQKYSSTAHLHISKRPNKNSSNKKAPRKKCPSMFPKSGAPVEIDAHFRALLKKS